MHVHSSRLRDRRNMFVMLATTWTIALFLLGHLLFVYQPLQLYAQSPSTSADTLVVQTLDDAIMAGEPVCEATCTLRDAIRIANELPGPDTIVFADGLAGEITLVNVLTVNDDVTIEGPGADLLTISVPGSDAFNRRAFAINSTANVVLRGMTIQRTGEGDGGGIQNLGTLTLEEVVINNSDYNGNGGGVYNAGTLAVVNSVFRNNRGVQGGGIFNVGELIIIDTRISGSNATSIGPEGTAIRNEGGIITMTGATIEGSLRSYAVANYEGGRIIIERSAFEGNLQGGLTNEDVGSTVVIHESDFISNANIAIVNGGFIGGPAGGVVTITASVFEGPAIENRNEGTVTLLDSVLRGPKSGNGGTGIVNSGATFTMRNTTVTDYFLTGFASQGAGIINERSGTFLIEQSTISNNRADEDSEEIANDSDHCGGILNQGINASAEAPTTMIIRNSTISGNRALRSGGGLCAISSSPDNLQVTVINSTIANNRVVEPRDEDEGGGGIYLFNSSVTLVNSIVASNYRGEGSTLDNLVRDTNFPGTLTTQGVNLSDTQLAGFGDNDLVNIAPALGPLANNGGPTATHALLGGSPALDAANGELCPAIDQRGEPRPADGNDDERAICDIGAYEAQSAPELLDSTSSEGIFLPLIQSGS